MAVDLSDYGIAHNVEWVPGQWTQKGPSEVDLREKALMMAIDHHRGQHIGEAVQETAAKFLAFLKGAANV